MGGSPKYLLGPILKIVFWKENTDYTITFSLLHFSSIRLFLCQIKQKLQK